jgi:hypothetical protein
MIVQYCKNPNSVPRRDDAPPIYRCSLPEKKKILPYPQRSRPTLTSVADPKPQIEEPGVINPNPKPSLEMRIENENRFFFNNFDKVIFLPISDTAVDLWCVVASLSISPSLSSSSCSCLSSSSWGSGKPRTQAR